MDNGHNLVQWQARVRELEAEVADCRRQDRLLQQIIAHAPVGIAVLHGPEHRFLLVNPVQQEIAPARGRLIGKTVAEVWPEAAGEIVPLLDGVFRTGQPVYLTDLHLSLVRASSPAEGYFSFSYTPLRDAYGKVEGILVIAQDTTDRVREEQKLRETEARFRAILDNSPSVIYLKNREGHLILANQVFTTLFRQPLEHITGQANEALLAHADEAHAVREHDEQVMAQGQPLSFEEVITGPDGKPHTYISMKFPLRDSEGHVYGLGGISTDISERKRAEEERERLLLELDATIGAIAEGLIIYNAKVQIVRMNHSAEKILGFTEEERQQPFAIRLQLVKVYLPDGAPYLPERTPVMRALRGETVLGELMRLQKATGETIWVSASAGPIRRPDGTITGVISTFTDITRLHELQEQQETFMHTISHDLRTPLTTIQGHAQLLRDSMMATGGNGQSLASMEAILRSAHRMNVMIQDLVDAARWESGQLILHLQPVQLGAYLADFLKRSATAMAVARIRLDIPEDLPPVAADYNRLERIMNNLLSNALKYSADDAPVLLCARGRDGKVEIAIRDQGQGIAAEDLPHIFERFYRTKNGRRREGIGLGLYITHMLVEAHGGQIRVESAIGVGTTFIVTLPVADSTMLPQ